MTDRDLAREHGTDPQWTLDEIRKADGVTNPAQGVTHSARWDGEGWHFEERMPPQELPRAASMLGYVVLIFAGFGAACVLAVWVFA